MSQLHRQSDHVLWLHVLTPLWLEGGQTGSAHAGILIKEEPDLPDAAEQALEVEVAVQGVLGVNPHAPCRQSATDILNFRDFDILAPGCLVVGRLDIAVQILSGRLPARRAAGLQCGIVIPLEPAPGEAAEWGLGLVVASSDSPLLDFFGIQRRVIVEVHLEDVAGGTDGVENDIAAIFVAVLVHHVVLTVGGQVEPRQHHAGQHVRLPVASEGEALAVEELDLAVEPFGADVGDLADASQWRLVHQQGEDQPVLVRLLVTGVDLPTEKVLRQDLQRYRREPDWVRPKDW